MSLFFILPEQEHTAICSEPIVIMEKIVRISAEELKNTPLTDEEKEMMKRLEEIEPTPDEELPELTLEQLKEFKKLS